jgi:hypothetical protein
MKMLFKIYDGEELRDMGIIDTDEGEIHEAYYNGFEDWVEMEFSQPTTPELDQTDELLRTYGGPHIVAKPVDY